MSLLVATRLRASQNAAPILSSARLFSSSTVSRAALSPTLASQSGQDLLSGLNLKQKAPPKKKTNRRTMRLPTLSDVIKSHGRDSLASSESAAPTASALPPPPDKYFLHVHASSNNTILHLTNSEGNSLPGGRITAGMLGFKKVQRSQFEAGFQCALRIIRRIVEEYETKKAPPKKYRNASLESESAGLRDDPRMEVEVVFTGFGMGRDALFQALMTSEGNVARPLITRLTDRTPIKIGGTRSAKTRRL
ncbi:hypothetical protein FRC04_005863 [Tulasnella sp. 424]|nr:hypothetical protein FRC04_005863 [Tulasnella sp. 424]KAG8976007.1 hypothetical protein FRC05_004638 [Tulasnella sp. 425]